jgi:hypothetical protein
MVGILAKQYYRRSFPDKLNPTTLPNDMSPDTLARKMH